MTEDKLRLSPNELEGLLIKSCDCVLIGTEGISLKKCDTYIDKIRPFFVSTLERRIYALLEKFVYGEDADRFHKQFPCLKKCIDTTTALSGPANNCCTKYIGTEIVEGAIKGTIKYLIKEGLFTAFINSVVLNNRINRICRQLDALGIEKTCLGYLNVWNFVCAKDYWIGNPFEAPRDDHLSDLVVEVGTEDQEHLSYNNLKRSADEDPINENNSETETSSVHKIRKTISNKEISKTKSSVSDSDKKMRTEHLRLSISKVQFADCGCVEIVRPKKFSRLKLPCKSEELIRKIFRVDKKLPHSCLWPVRKKFEDALHNICSCLNDILSRTDKSAIKNLYLVCEIRPGYVSFKLKSIQGQSSGSKLCLFSARVATCRSVFKNQTSFRKSLTKEDLIMTPRKETSDQNDFGEPSRSEISRANCYESHLSDVQEKEEENDETDGRVLGNVDDISDSETVVGEETVFGEETVVGEETVFGEETVVKEGTVVTEGSVVNEETVVKEGSVVNEETVVRAETVVKEETIVGEETNSQITLDTENESNNFEGVKFTCSCGQVSTCSRSSFFKIEMKLLEVSDCFKKPVLKEVNPVLKIEEEERTDSGKKELGKSEEIGEPEPTTTSSNLEQLKVSETIFPDPKEADVSKLVCSAKEDRNLLKNETNNSKIVPDSQDLPESGKVPKETKSQIPVPISSRKKLSQASTGDLNLEKETILKECKPKVSKIPLLVKEEAKISGFGISSSSTKSKSRLRSTEKLESVATSTSKNRIGKPGCSEFSRSSQLKKSDHLVRAGTCNKSCNPTFARPFNRSVATVPKRQEKAPEAAKRNFITRPNPQPRSSEIKKREGQQIKGKFPKIRESVCSKTFVKDKDENSLMNVYQRNQEKVPQRTYIIVTDSEEGIGQCDSSCPCRQFISEKVFLSLSPQSPNSHSLDLKLSSSCHLKSQIGKVSSPTFTERKKKSNVRTVSVQTAERKMISKGININIKETRETSSKGFNVDWRQDVNINSINSTKGVNTDLIPKDSVISLQTNVTKIISVFDITIFEEDFERLKEPLKGVFQMRNFCQEENTYQPTWKLKNTCQSTCKPTNTCQLTFKSANNCQPTCQPANICQPTCKPTNTCQPTCKPENNCQPTCKPANNCQPTCKPPNTCQLTNTCQPTNICQAPNNSQGRNNFSVCYKREKNSKFHLRSEHNSDVSAEICKGIPKRSGDRRHKMSGIGDLWTTPNKTRAQNIMNTICDSFANKSIKRIKYLIQTKLCRILLDRDSNDGSKTFVSSQRYYVSASREKNCYSPCKRNVSESSESKSSPSSESSSDHCCRQERMAGGSDKLYECPIRIGSGWEFGGDEDCFLIRKRGKASQQKDFKTPKGKEIKISKARDSKSSRNDVRTSKGKDERCEKKYLDFGPFSDSIGSNKLGIGKGDDRNKRKERKNTFPGDVITSSHLGRRHEKALRKRSFRSCSCHESDKENGGREYKRGSQESRGKSRVCSGRGEMNESFCDLEQNVRIKLSEYVDLCKSAKYILMKGSDDVYSVSSTSIPFSDRGEFRRS